MRPPVPPPLASNTNISTFNENTDRVVACTQRVEHTTRLAVDGCVHFVHSSQKKAGAVWDHVTQGRARRHHCYVGEGEQSLDAVDCGEQTTLGNFENWKCKRQIIANIIFTPLKKRSQRSLNRWQSFSCKLHDWNTIKPAMAATITRVFTSL